MSSVLVLLLVHCCIPIIGQLMNTYSVKWPTNSIDSSFDISYRVNRDARTDIDKDDSLNSIFALNVSSLIGKFNT